MIRNRIFILLCSSVSHVSGFSNVFVDPLSMSLQTTFFLLVLFNTETGVRNEIMP